jgi:hypothetical protein
MMGIRAHASRPAGGPAPVALPCARAAAAHDAVPLGAGHRVVGSAAATAGRPVPVQPAGRPPALPILSVCDWFHVVPVHAGSVRACLPATACCVPGMTFVVRFDAFREWLDVLGVGPGVRVPSSSSDLDSAITAGRADVSRPRPAFVVRFSCSGFRQKLFRLSSFHGRWQRISVADCSCVARSAEFTAYGLLVRTVSAGHHAFDLTMMGSGTMLRSWVS